MKLTINKNQINEHGEQFLRRAGYGFIRDRQRGKESYVRRLTRDHYPRLHMYVSENGGKIIFDLHLDQKQVSYKGASHMHNAEHDGEVVEGEIERLRSLVSPASSNNNGTTPNNTRAEERIGHGTYDKNLKPKKKKGLLARLFS